jgi:hypothetical protein
MADCKPTERHEEIQFRLFLVEQRRQGGAE